jgi:hypothetical protein
MVRTIISFWPVIAYQTGSVGVPGTCNSDSLLKKQTDEFI